jgi:TPR repeat protein
MTRRAAIIWVWGLVLIAGAIGGGYAWWRQQDVTQAYEAGRAAADADRWEEALTLAQPYTGRDDPRINGLLADAYINGPDSIKDIDEGLTLRRRATEAGNMRAAYFLGKWILENEPTDAQAHEAIGFLQEAADCGMPMANFDLGFQYLDGTWIKRNFDKAIYYSERAAFSGVPDAAWNAGLAYGKIAIAGNFSEDTLDKVAMNWWFVSAWEGDPDAKETLNEIRSKTTAKFGDDGDAWYKKMETDARRWAKKINPATPYACQTTAYRR